MDMIKTLNGCKHWICRGRHYVGMSHFMDFYGLYHVKCEWNILSATHIHIILYWEYCLICLTNLTNISNISLLLFPRNLLWYHILERLLNKMHCQSSWYILVEAVDEQIDLSEVFCKAISLRCDIVSDSVGIAGVKY